jgi:glycosyltransferase A (GT-A) superfamily protein (DUF2064 family)
MLTVRDNPDSTGAGAESAAALGTVLVIAKAPRPGRAKTRLAPEFGPDGAARLAAAALSDTLAAARRIPSAHYVIAWDGPRGHWLPADFRVIDQAQGGLDARLSAAFDAAAGDGPALLVGMDTPQLRPDLLGGFDPSIHDACLGLARDGGFWAIGFADPALARAAIGGVPMSTARTGSIQLSRLRALGLRVRLLPTLRDVDEPADAHAVAATIPRSAFAATLRDVVRRRLVA